jgi:hypothetical protein
VTSRSRLSTRWLARTLAVLVGFWTAAVVVPFWLGASPPWRALAAGLILPGSGLLYSIPPMSQPISAAMVIGHTVVIAVALGAVPLLVRGFRGPWIRDAAVVTAIVVLGALTAPYVVVVIGHVVAFVGVLAACGWAVGARLIARADSVTLAAVVMASAVVGALLTAVHGDHLANQAWIPWAAWATVMVLLVVSLLRGWIGLRSARQVGEDRWEYLNQRASGRASVSTSPVALRRSAATEATDDQLRLLRYLLAVALSPIDSWAGFDNEARGPLQQYRYQVNAVGWALAMYNYAHVPAFAGALTTAQLALIARAQHKSVWGYWYTQNLLGNWDFIKRRADPIDVPQNIMFSGYLNLQLAMYRQATGDSRFDSRGSLRFDWSPRQQFSYDHQRLNSIVIRNFDQDLCLWPCEPVLSPGRKRGFVFPYCNTVTTAGVAIMDQVNGTDHATIIARRLTEVLDREYTRAANDIAAFMVSGLGLSIRRVMSGTGSTAGIAAFIAPLQPELAWRAWEILKRDWLDTGLYRMRGSAGAEMPDWASGARTNAETLSAAMHLAHAVGDDRWHAELWAAAVDQLNFGATNEAGMARFAEASVHANGMLAFACFGRAYAFGDMLTTPHPAAWQDGPRLAEAPHPDVLVARAESDGAALDLVVLPGTTSQRVRLRLDRLRPGASYLVHGAVERDICADGVGGAYVTVDLAGRTTVTVRPAATP